MSMRTKIQSTFQSSARNMMLMEENVLFFLAAGVNKIVMRAHTLTCMRIGLDHKQEMPYTCRKHVGSKSVVIKAEKRNRSSCGNFTFLPPSTRRGRWQSQRKSSFFEENLTGATEPETILT